MKRLIDVLLSTLLFLPGCSPTNESTSNPQKELLIYCGITMIKPMSEIARLIEKQENCKITITKGGSGNLLKSIRANRIGDLYLSGSDSYIKSCKEEGLITESAFVGRNKAVMMVQKGNPTNISSNLDYLLRKDLYVVIGNPNSGSIGWETKKSWKRKTSSPVLLTTPEF
jgi:molybdate transport system substrate-binding protein